MFDLREAVCIYGIPGRRPGSLSGVSRRGAAPSEDNGEPIGGGAMRDWKNDKEICDAYAVVRPIGDTDPMDDADEAFLAAAREGWPAALKEIERLRVCLDVIAQDNCGCCDSAKNAKNALHGKPSEALDKLQAKVEQLREIMRRHLPILEALEVDLASWDWFADGTGITTLNEYRATLKEADNG